MDSLYKIMLICFMLISGSFVSYAQTAVPVTVKKSFTKNYPSVSKVTWEHKKDGYQASFIQTGRATIALFNERGARLEAGTAITSSGLPSAAIDHIQANYKGAAIKKPYKIMKANDEIHYEVTVNGKKLRFTEQGKVVK